MSKHKRFCLRFLLQAWTEKTDWKKKKEKAVIIFKQDHEKDDSLI